MMTMQALFKSALGLPLATIRAVPYVVSLLETLDLAVEYEEAEKRYTAQTFRVEANASEWSEEQLRQEWAELDRLYAAKDIARHRLVSAKDTVEQRRRAIQSALGRAA